MKPNNPNKPITGLRCEIYRCQHGDCSNNGLSSRVKEVTLINAEGPFEPDESAPAVILVHREISGKRYTHAEPAEPCPSNAVRMDGGTFIYSCDSRFARAIGHHQPIALHDRHE